MGDQEKDREGATIIVAGRVLVAGTEQGIRDLVVEARDVGSHRLGRLGSVDTIDPRPSGVRAMALNEYLFVTRWRVEASREEVFAVLTDSESLTRWWPSVYRRVQPIAPPTGSDGVGKRLLLDTQGWLPYRLRWELRVVERQAPSRLALEASGDFVGIGVWTLAQAGDVTDVRYEWAIRAHKPLLRYLSFLLKPVFSLNHRWAMARGLESLELELARRRGELAAPPRGPVSALWSGLVLTGVLVALALTLFTMLS